ncbi:MAG: Aliphatic sulfonates import ATP-binding protein SsuB [Burkholderia sp.]
MLIAKGVKKTFFPGSVNEKKALQGVDLTLENGDFVTVIGSNGAGKSTFLNAVAGVFPIDEGTIEIGGFDVTKMPEYKRAKFIGRVFQDPMKGTAANMMIKENLAMASRRGKKLGLAWSEKEEDNERFAKLLKQFDLGLEDRLTARVGLLSGGQRQALTLLMATLQRPQLLLLDEHTAALDPKTAAKVLELTDRIVQAEHLTTLMITHNMRDALRYGNRLVMMHEGRIVVDVKGDEKKNLTVRDLLALFEKGAGTISDAMLLS